MFKLPLCNFSMENAVNSAIEVQLFHGSFAVLSLVHIMM